MTVIVSLLTISNGVNVEFFFWLGHEWSRHETEEEEIIVTIVL